MSGLDMYTPQESIRLYLEQEFPNHRVITDALYDDENLIREGTTLVPYITIRYGRMRPRPAGKSMGGHRYDEYYSTVDVGVVAPTGDIARRHLNVVRDRLIGFKPEGAEKVYPSLVGNEDTIAIGSKAKPSAYFDSQRFEYGLNGEGVGEYIPRP